MTELFAILIIALIPSVLAVACMRWRLVIRP